MKTSFLHMLSLALIISITTACGKSGGGGGSTAAATGTTVSNASATLDATSAAALAALFVWYDSLTEGALPSLSNGLLTKQVTKRVQTISASNNCSTQPVSVFGISLGNINYCGSISGSGSGTSSTSYVTMIPSGDKKTGNAELAAALAPAITAGANGLTLTSVSQAASQSGSGTVFSLTYTVAATTTTAAQTVIQVIDTAYNSRLNPVYTMDQVNGKITTVTNIAY